MKKYITTSVLLCFTLAYSSGTQLNKDEILSILKKSANAKDMVGKKPPTKKNTVKRVKKNSPKTKRVYAKSTRDAEIRSGIILPNNNGGIKAKETDNYKHLPYGSLPNVSITNHRIRGMSLEKRFKLISGEEIIEKKKVALTPTKKINKTKVDRVDRLY